ncbi:MAG TPA: queuosine precursor transporter [Massilibacterium sp.]|nr:queuosine precursor transporter [Massilibacterium sp.]
MTIILLWLFSFIVTFSFTLLCYKFFGKTGLYAWIAMATVVANMQVLKTIELFGITLTLGNIMYGTTFFVIVLLNEKYGEKAAKKAVYLGFFILVTTTLIMQIILWFPPHPNDFAHPHLEAIFGLLPRLAAGSVIGYYISHMLNVTLYRYFQKKFSDRRYLWLRNSGSTSISQLFDTLIFCVIAFWGIYPFDIWLEIAITTYVMKWLVAVLDTPFIYLAQKINVNDE